ncbi:MAG: hypothetical protein ACJ8F3_08920 [Xanthobacteraceae bacterium]
MRKVLWLGLLVVVLASAAVAVSLDVLGLEQIVYVLEMIAGWTAWTLVVAVAYAGLERLVPGLRAPVAKQH